MARVELPKWNAIANIFALLAAFFWCLPLGSIFALNDAIWSNAECTTTCKAGMVFISMTTGSAFFLLFGILEGRFEPWNVFFTFVYSTVAVSIITARKIPLIDAIYPASGDYQKTWMFAFLWSSWVFFFLHFVISYGVNFMFFKEKDLKMNKTNTCMPNLRSLCGGQDCN